MPSNEFELRALDPWRYPRIPPKNERNNSIKVLLGKKTNSFVCFLEEFDDSKNPFEIN